MKNIPIVIPAYEPNEKLLELAERLKSKGGTIVVVDDGSGEAYGPIFDKLKDMGVIVLKHSVNMGKGRALKTAFNFCLNEYPNLIGVVTADSDGQHSTTDICRLSDTLCENKNNLILGCRNFDVAYIPDKSKMGNKITRRVCKYLCGIDISDTQTGLRGIPKNFMKDLLNVSGERFEYETNMLIVAKDNYPIKEIEIETIYDSKENHATHFDPVRDSIKIYKIFGRMFLKFIISSLSSSVLDLALFTAFCSLLRNDDGVRYVAWATVIARVISATYNYLLNYKVVFKSDSNYAKSSVKYMILAVVQMTLSAAIVSGGVTIFTTVPEVVVKIVVDSLLFLVSFYIQREVVFKE